MAVFCVIQKLNIFQLFLLSSFLLNPRLRFVSSNLIAQIISNLKSHNPNLTSDILYISNLTFSSHISLSISHISYFIFYISYISYFISQECKYSVIILFFGEFPWLIACLKGIFGLALTLYPVLLLLSCQ